MDKKRNADRDVYTIDELASSYLAGQWQTSPELIIAALRLEGKGAYTKEQAREIVENLKHKEVL